MVTISLRCYGLCAFHQPDPPVLNLPDGSTVADALARLNLPDGLETVPLMDGKPASRSTVLHDGSVLSLVPIVGGG